MFETIDKFLEYNKNKPVIVVQGLGFVGAVMSLVCANSQSTNYAVIGVDLATPESQRKIDLLNSGTFPLDAEDPKINEYFLSCRQNKNFYATNDINSYSFADIVIVDVNLDVDKVANNDRSLESYDVNLSSFESAIRVIGQNCKDDVLVLVETTVPPGTTINLVKPIIFEEISKRGLSTSKTKIAHSYERCFMPGPDYIDSIQNYPEFTQVLMIKVSMKLNLFWKQSSTPMSANLHF